MDDDSCVMKYIEIVPRDQFEDCSDVTDVKCEPLSVKIENDDVVEHNNTADVPERCDADLNNAVTEQRQGSEHQLQNTAVPFNLYKTPADEMTISDDCGLQDDQRDGSSNVVHSTVMDCEHVNIKQEEWEEDISCSLLSRHTYDMGHDLSRSLGEVERDQEVEVAECKYNTNASDQMISSHYVCDVCNKVFSQLCDLNHHRLAHKLAPKPTHKPTHTGRTPSICDVCNKAFKHSGTLNRHKRTHTGHKPYVCDVCNKAFSQRSHLKRHSATHTVVTPYVCDACGKTYKYLCKLTNHKHIHTCQTPYICDICGKAFTHRGNLSLHKRSHTGDTPYSCDVCNKAFTHRGILSLHKRSHTGKTRLYSCDVCNKPFPHLSALKRHKRSHSRDKPYICDICNKAFTYQSTLNRHRHGHV